MYFFHGVYDTYTSFKYVLVYTENLVDLFYDNDLCSRLFSITKIVIQSELSILKFDNLILKHRLNLITTESFKSEEI